MANIIIHSDERKAETNRTLRDYGINPEHATKAQRDMVNHEDMEWDQKIQMLYLRNY